MEKQKYIFLHKHGLSPKIFYKKKCLNYGKSNLQQNSIKGPTDLNSAKKCQKEKLSSEMSQKLPQKA